MFFKKKENLAEFEIYAPADGTAISLAEVPDPVFAELMLGDGIAVIPADGTIVSPVTGVVEQVTDTLHAYGLISDDGVEILVHIGIDTVKLSGEGFTPLKQKGDKVAVGDPLAKVDLDLLKSKGYDIHTPVIVTNMDKLKSLKPIEGTVRAGESPIMTFTCKD